MTMRPGFVGLSVDLRNRHVPSSSVGFGVACFPRRARRGVNVGRGGRARSRPLPCGGLVKQQI